jgi:hypothetical protein
MASLFVLIATLATCLASSEAPAHVLDARAVDLDGRVHRLGFEEEPVPVALVFLDVECPVSNRYAPRLNELATAAQAKGIAFYGVLSDPALSVERAREYRSTRALAFPVLFDSAGDLAARLGPTTVPEAFVIDAFDQLVYHGRIDDRFVEPGSMRAAPTHEDLRDALEALAAGGDPPSEHATAIGCVFEAWKDPVSERSITYGRHVAPILNAHCIECHRSGDIGPFPLATYEEARKRSRMIAQVTESRFMPPWHAAPDFGDFQGERRLARGQIEVLQRWAETGAPRGDAADELPSTPLPSTRWRLGEPDLLVRMPVDYAVPAAGDDIYRYFVVPNELVAGRDVVAVDFRPGDPGVVHHCIAYLDPTRRARKLDEQDEAPGFAMFGNDAGFLQTNMVAGWAPGAQPARYAKGLGFPLPAGGDFVLEVHYHLNGKATTDRSALAFYFSDEPVERHVQTLVIGTDQIDIPPGEPSYRRRVWMEVPKDCELIEVTPHMHFLGKDVEATATLPDGEVLPLIRVPRWDFRWQDTYVYRSPLFLPEGTRIETRFTFDNSSANPFNPSSPPIRVTEGWRTTDEMCLFYFSVVPMLAEDGGAIEQASYASFLRSAEF